jgi:hypothetical protein
MFFKSSLEIATKIKTERKCDKEIPKNIGGNLAKFSRKNGNIGTNYSCSFYFSHFGEMSHQKNAALTHRNEPPKEIDKFSRKQ